MKIKIKDRDKTSFFKISQGKEDLRLINEMPCNICEEIVTKEHDKLVGKCKDCNNIMCFFSPFPLQEIALLLNVKILANIGGVGSGKTLGSSLIIQQGLREIPGTAVVAVAPRLQQLNSTGKKELEKFFLKEEWVIKNEKTWVFKNGSRVDWFASDKQDNIRGLNASKFWIIEAGGIKRTIFTQALSRIRDNTQKTFDEEGNVLEDYAQIIIEANPKDNWIRQSLLMKAKAVFYTKNVANINIIKKLIKPSFNVVRGKKVYLDIVVLLQSTVDNPIATDEYIANIYGSLPPNEASMEIYCDMSFSSNLIFYQEIRDGMFLMKPEEEHSSFIVDGENMKWIEGIDQGGVKDDNDPTAYILATVEKTSYDGLPKIVIRDGFRESGLTLEETASKIWQIRVNHDWQSDKTLGFVADPSVKKLNHNGRSYLNDLRDFNIYMTAKVDNNIKYGMSIIKMLAKYDLVKIPSYMDELYKEIKGLQWTTKTVIENGEERIVKQPKAGNDHLIDVVRYMCVSLKITNREAMKLMLKYHSKNFKAKHISSNDEYIKNVNNMMKPKSTRPSSYNPYGARSPISNKYKDTNNVSFPQFGKR